ncbi:MAG: glycosyltransferase family 4 protein [Rhodospirillaceae bacterium]|nr:glycosyltransferase family 4 protein [Rhodospirillaceae bacterium]
MGQPAGGAGRTAIVVKGYPRLSETFIAQEILALQQRGQAQLIVSLRHPTDSHVHDLNRRITAPVLYLPEYLRSEPRRVLAAWAWARRQPGYRAALAAFLADWRRDPGASRGRRFGQACVLARELPGDVDRLHSHYLHTPASTTRYAALIRGLPWSFSAHAKDIWTTPAWDLRRKLASAAWGVTCTAANRRYLNGLAPADRPVALVYHGLDFSRFPKPAVRPPRDGSDPDDPVRIVSVGRAVEKKGYDVLLTALAGLPAGLHWRFVHIGGGQELARLRSLAQGLGLAEKVDWRGAQAQDKVVQALCEADLFVLAARIARNGDRDGLPNVLMEAQAVGLACLATKVSAIPELIEDGRTGRLVAPDDAAALGRGLAGLIACPDDRQRLGAAGAARVRRDFSFERGIDWLAARFDLADDACAAATA